MKFVPLDEDPIEAAKFVSLLSNPVGEIGAAPWWLSAH